MFPQQTTVMKKKDPGGVQAWIPLPQQEDTQGSFQVTGPVVYQAQKTKI